MKNVSFEPGKLGAGDHLTPRIKFSIVGQSGMWLYTNSTDILVQFFGDNHVVQITLCQPVYPRANIDLFCFCCFVKRLLSLPQILLLFQFIVILSKSPPKNDSCHLHS